jgi:hypothetical protein
VDVESESSCHLCDKNWSCFGASVDLYIKMVCGQKLWRKVYKMLETRLNEGASICLSWPVSVSSCFTPIFLWVNDHIISAVYVGWYSSSVWPDQYVDIICVCEYSRLMICTGYIYVWVSWNLGTLSKKVLFPCSRMLKSPPMWSPIHVNMVDVSQKSIEHKAKNYTHYLILIQHCVPPFSFDFLFKKVWK